MVRVRTPGPGTYSVPEYLKMGGSGAAATTVFGHATDKPKASAVFASGTEQGLRLDKVVQGSNDPGTYDFETLGLHAGNHETLAHRSRRTFNRDASHGRDAFTSRTKRPTSAPPRSRPGGPGEYELDHVYSIGRASPGSPGPTAPTITSSFRSNLPLGGHIRPTDSPGPGAYDMPEKPDKRGQGMSRDGQSSFAGLSPRGRKLASKTTSPEVGSGSYDPKVLRHGRDANIASIKHNKHLPPFISSMARALQQEAFC